MRRNGSRHRAILSTQSSGGRRAPGDASKDWSFGASTAESSADRPRFGVGLCGEPRGHKTSYGIGFAAVLVVSALLSAAAGAPVAAGRPVSRTVEIVYTSPAALRAALRSRPGGLVRVVGQLRAIEVRPRGDVGTFVHRLRHAPGVSAVRLTVPRGAADSLPASGLAVSPAAGASEWQYGAAGVDRVPAAVLAGARNVTIAVIDSGADLSAPDLVGKVAAAYDVRTGRRAVTDETGHGTFVASLAAGTGSGGVTGFGGAARLLVIKAAGSAGFTDLDVAAGIVYAVRHGARIINLSVAGRTRSPVEESAIQYASDRGSLVVAAAGNDALNGNPPEFPAALLQPVGSNGAGGIGLAVGASDSRGSRAPFSESGSYLSLSAPGVSVLGALSSRASATTPGLDGLASGTSFAAPEVSGAAALVWSADPSLSAKQVADILKQTASGHGSWTPDLGFGVLDVAAAVAQAMRTAASPQG
jgi:subtilisin family serine protease